MKLKAGHKLEIILTILVFFCTGLASTGLTSFGGRQNYDFWAVQPVSASTVRLHVVADSNEPDSQIFKMKIVEQVQRFLTEDKPCRVGRDYEQYLLENLSRIEDHLQQYAAVNTPLPPGIKVSLVREEFPLRAYGRIIYPPGEYKALKVNIGAGNGDNWWCLLFPPLCLPYAQEAEPVKIHVPQDEPGEEVEKDSSGTNKSAVPEEKDGWKFFIEERWNRWFRNN